MIIIGFINLELDSFLHVWINHMTKILEERVSTIVDISQHLALRDADGIKKLLGHSEVDKPGYGKEEFIKNILDLELQLGREINAERWWREAS